MASADEEIISLIQQTYIPCLERVIGHIKKKGNLPKGFDKLESVYRVFLDSNDNKKKVETYHANQSMLEKWHQHYQAAKGRKSSAVSTASEDSQHSETSFPTSRDVTSSVAFDGNVPAHGEIPIVGYRQRYTHRPDGLYVDNTIEPGSLPTAPIHTSLSSIVCTVASAHPDTENSSLTRNDGNISFPCASCDFSTTDEIEFAKHSRTDHRSDMSQWCKQCGRCFGNNSNLIAHIKEADCKREYMIYRCGIKDCTFGTLNGQPFVHHLRHCHKGIGFICCMQCQKIFTLPHCLIIHMQNECPFKERCRIKQEENIKSESLPLNNNNDSLPLQTSTTVVKNYSHVKAEENSIESSTVPSQQNVPRRRGRPKGIRNDASFKRHSVEEQIKDDSSRRHSVEAQIKDDSSRKHSVEEQIKDDSSRRHSVEEQIKDDSSRKHSVKVQIKADSSRRHSVKAQIKDDSSRRHLKRASTILSLKSNEVRNTRSLRHRTERVKYFENSDDLSETDSSSESKENEIILEQVDELFNCKSCDFTSSSKQSLDEHNTTNHSNLLNDVMKKTPLKTETAATRVDDNIPKRITAPMSKVKTINDTNSIMKIPYQTSNDTRHGNGFEDLKSPNDLIKMKNCIKLRHFFKCCIYNCPFTTDDSGFYVRHVKEHHEGKKLHCSYCLIEVCDAQTLVDHMLNVHGTRHFQCSLCFYRAQSKPHVQVHMKSAHREKGQVFSSGLHLPPGYHAKDYEVASVLTTTYPYVCAVGACNFKAVDVGEFKIHSERSHASLSSFVCYYCKDELASIQLLVRHCQNHGMNMIQCTYCVHGTETQEKMLLHMSIMHPDKRIRANMRKPQEVDVTKNSNNVVKITGNSGEACVPKNEGSLLLRRKKIDDYFVSKAKEAYPSEVLCFEKDFFCRLAFCDKELPNFSSYVKHLMDDHCAINFPCPYCSKVLNDITRFKNHVMNHGPNLFACVSEECSWNSWNSNDVLKHMEAVHSHIIDAYPKVIRQTLSSDLAMLENVMQDAFPKNITESDKTFVCLFCYFKTSSAAVMKNHMYLEFIYKRFICNVCKARCHSRKDARQHFSENHANHNVKCTIDGSSEIEFFVKSAVYPDVQKVLSNYVMNEDECYNPAKDRFACFSLKYVCDKCSETFTRIRELHFHLLSCLFKEYQPYICNQCEQKEYDLMDIKLHTHKSHPNTEITFSAFRNRLYDEQAVRKMQQLRLDFIKKIMISVLGSQLNTYIESLCKPTQPKCYKCSYCEFRDNFSSNVTKHCEGWHVNRPVRMDKIGYNPKLSFAVAFDAQVSFPSTHFEIVQTTSSDLNTSRKLYECGFCSKRLDTLFELDNHVALNHRLGSVKSYLFFYWPKPDIEYTLNERMLYECFFCTWSPENLYHLKQHYRKLHPKEPFKVKNIRSKECPVVQCIYCTYTVMSEELLTKHCQFSHPAKAQLPSKTENKPVERKLQSESVPVELEAVKLKEKLVCNAVNKSTRKMHEEAAPMDTGMPELQPVYETTSKAVKRKIHDSDSMDEDAPKLKPMRETRSKALKREMHEKSDPLDRKVPERGYVCETLSASAMRRLPELQEAVEQEKELSFNCKCRKRFYSYDELSKHLHDEHPNAVDRNTKVSTSNFDNFALLKCQICTFVAEEKALYEHIALKHKNCVGCGHCQKHLVSILELEEHYKREHKGKSLIIVNVNEKAAGQAKSMNPSSRKVNELLSKYKATYAPLDLENITVNISTYDGHGPTKMPAIYVICLLKMFPKVVLTDIFKS